MAFLIIVGIIAFNVYKSHFTIAPIDVANNSRCRVERDALEEFKAGVLTKKFRDKESHMWEKVEYS